MAKILLYVFLLSTLSSSILHPWIGVGAYYLVSILHPQGIWFWAFGGIRVSFYVSIAAILGFLIATIKGQVDFSILKSKQNLYLIIILISVYLSDYFSAYAYDPTFLDNQGNKMLSPARTLDSLGKIYLFYFISILLIDNKKKYHYLVIGFLAIVVYYIYWGNALYFTGGMQTPRLTGPLGRSGSGTIYSDENTFGMLFVLAIPFLYFMGIYYKNKLIRYFLWGMIPWAWHAVFLTASRGALLGVGFTSLYIVFRSKSRVLGVGLLVCLIVAFSLQGGLLKNRAEGLTKEEGRRNPRLESWETGIKMIIDHPFFGIGIAKFVVAYPDYADTQPYVAHNTAVQLGSECGVLAGVMYLLLAFSNFMKFLKQKEPRLHDHHDELLYLSTDAVICSLGAFFIISIFLNLIGYEIFYFLLILNIVGDRLKHLEQATSLESTLQKK